MTGSQIDAQEEFVHKLYGEDYLYQIPQFQRPFSWTEENFVDLIDDLTDAYEVNSSSKGRMLDEEGRINPEVKDEYEPYFLGSIILNEGSATGDRYDVIDGQQRLTSRFSGTESSTTGGRPRSQSLSRKKKILQRDKPEQ
jgi:uncharacterized protein with ParB-like and HNH nuclease domain